MAGPRWFGSYRLNKKSDFQFFGFSEPLKNLTKNARLWRYWSRFDGNNVPFFGQFDRVLFWIFGSRFFCWHFGYCHYLSYDFLFLLLTNFSLPPKINCRNHSFQRAGAGFCDDTSMTPSRRHTRPRSCLVFIPAQYRCSSLQTGLDIVFMDDLLLNFARFFCAPG